MTDETERVISKKDFVLLVREANLNRTKVASPNGVVGESVKYAIEEKHLNRAAFSAVAKLCRMVDQANSEDAAAADEVAENARRLQAGIKQLDPTFEDDAESARPSRRNHPAKNGAEPAKH